jgi:ABC-type sugar transport system substrate-binding protein
MWKGIDQVERELMDYSLTITRLECGDNYDWQNEEKILEEMAARHNMDGLVLSCWDETMLNPVIDRLYEQGIPVVTANADAIGSKRLVCVSAPNERVGRLAAELLNALEPKGDRIVLAGGLRMVSTHQATREGFRAFMEQKTARFSITEVLDCEAGQNFEENLSQVLKCQKNVCGIYAITARDTYRTCKVVKALGLSGKIPVVGSDVFEELLPWFEDGALLATVWKDPQAQAEQAVWTLYRHLIGHPMDYDPIKMGIVLSTNAKDYL